jgi:transglutaminase-like putative cysteine protease
MARSIAPKDVVADFNARKGVECMDARINQVENMTMSDDERACMRFLYAYMQLPDIVDYSPDFYLGNVRSTLRTLEEMPWGKIIPDRELRHFVLPIRVNNEFLDASREAFYGELRERVRNLTMEDAILEVNHWCHEKVTYQPSDARTSSPLATVKSAIGRCGEESTFTVAALRAVGIPARQVYTPRWAHTDDNHAWVEAWANGKWYFLGACEPEAVLNLGWFNAPASRGMMMNTKVFGNYDGPEEVITRNAAYTTINVTKNYAPVSTVKVKVVDSKGKKVKDANVEFTLYNYAEFYTIAQKCSDSKGVATLTTGLGDMLVWASKDGKYGWAKATAGKSDVVEVRLDKSASYRGVEDIDIIPPKGGGLIPKVTPDLAEKNNLRKEREDSIRKAYEATFITADAAKALAARWNIDDKEMVRVLTGSRGNHATLVNFLTAADDKVKGLALLSSLTDKDLRDIRGEVLADAMTVGTAASKDEVDYVMNPRVEYENLTTFKDYFTKNIPADKRSEWHSDPSKMVAWVAGNIKCDDTYNLQGIRMNPESVYELRTADAKSRDIFFVKLARALDIKAQLDPVDGAVLYYDEASAAWVKVDFDKSDMISTEHKGAVMLNFTPHKYMTDPVYYTHFAITRIENGEKQLMEYPEDATYSNTFATRVPLDAGDYMLVSGQRLASGEVLGRIYNFNVFSGETTRVPLEILADDSEISVIGNFNAENIYYDLTTDTDKSVLSTTGRGYYILGVINSNHEPSEHLLNEISAMKDEFEAYGKPVILLFADHSVAARFDASRFPNLPSNIRFGVDTTGEIASEILESMGAEGSEFPLLIVADTFNRIVSFSRGYSIGSANRVLDVIKRVEE